VERDLDAPHFCNTDKEIAGHPEVVTHRNTFAGADLEFPLRWHDLCVDPANVNACIQTSTVMGLDEVTGKNLAGSYRGGGGGFGTDNRKVVG
jgi:hypothetical protein